MQNFFMMINNMRRNVELNRARRSFGRGLRRPAGPNRRPNPNFQGNRGSGFQPEPNPYYGIGGFGPEFGEFGYEGYNEYVPGFGEFGEGRPFGSPEENLINDFPDDDEFF